MAPRRERIRRTLSRSGVFESLHRGQDLRGAGRRGGPNVDFTALELPADVREALAEAFWHHYGPRPIRTARRAWSFIKVFARFVRETDAVRTLVDIDAALLMRYIEWLGTRRGARGSLWSKTTRSATYGTLQKLLQWLARCRPGLIAPIEYPSNPFPLRNREASHRTKVTPERIRTLLWACEQDIEQIRRDRKRADEERVAARSKERDPLASLGALLEIIDERFAGIVPSHKALVRRGNYQCYRAVAKYGRKSVETCLYPRIDTILPYYLAILIHTAGNPRAIAGLDCDCLQAVPMLEDRELLVWSKPRAATLQRRSFRSEAPFEPPALVRELIAWTRRLRPRARETDRHKLFLLKTPNGVRALSDIVLFTPLRDFETRHRITHVAAASVRPSVLTALYRSTGDLMKVKTVANHAQISTTVAYVETPEVEAQNRGRIAAIQEAFLGHIERAARIGTVDSWEGSSQAPRPPVRRSSPLPSAPAVSMFGFNCLDPLAGIAPGTHAGELCNNFLACFTCPNAVIASDARTLARLLQARDHLRAAAAYIHPARWEAIYAPSLRILEEDILTRFAGAELAEAEKHARDLTALPPLR